MLSLSEKILALKDNRRIGDAFKTDFEQCCDMAVALAREAEEAWRAREAELLKALEHVYHCGGHCEPGCDKAWALLHNPSAQAALERQRELERDKERLAQILDVAQLEFHGPSHRHSFALLKIISIIKGCGVCGVSWDEHPPYSPESPCYGTAAALDAAMPKEGEQ